VHFARGLTLRLALHAVELAAVRLRHDFSLFDVPPHLVIAAGPHAGSSTAWRPHLKGDRYRDQRQLGRP
jgi:hypothetical protein